MGYFSYSTLLTPQGRQCRIDKNKGKLFYYLYEEEIVSILAFIGGYIDAAGYVKFDGLFTSSITGNLVAACASIYHTDRVASRAVVCITFGLGTFTAVSMAMKLKMKYEWKPRDLTRLLFGMEVVLLFVTMVLGLVYDDAINGNYGNSDWQMIITSAFMGYAMGVHNAAAKEAIANCPATTVMTMTIVTVATNTATTFMYRLAKDGHNALYPVNRSKPADYDKNMVDKFDDALPKLTVSSRPMFLFVIGALFGGILATTTTFWCILIPLGLCLGVILDITMGKKYDVSERLAPLKVGSPVGNRDGNNDITSPLTTNQQYSIELNDSNEAKKANV